MPGLIILLAGLAVGLLCLIREYRRMRTPPDLRGDWWTRFEREFRAYARAGNPRSKHPPGRKREES